MEYFKKSNFVLFFAVLLCAHPCFAGDSLKKLARELAKLTVEYETLRIETPFTEGSPYQVSLMPVLSNPSRQLELREEISTVLEKTESALNKESTSGHLMKKNWAISGAYFLGFAGSVILALPYVHLLPIFIKPLMAIPAWASALASMHYESNVRFYERNNKDKILAQDYSDQLKKFYETYRKELKRLGASADLPAWKELGAAQRMRCEELFLNTLHFKLLAGK